MPPEPRAPLTSEGIVDAAIRVTERDGLPKLSMRNIATELGFEAMSLYSHVGNKADVLTGMVEAIAAQVELPEIDHSFAWRDALRRNALDLKVLFEQHPWAPELWLRSVPGPRRFDLMEWQLAALATSGLSEHDAHQAYHALFNHSVGTMLQRNAMAFTGNDPEIKAVMNSLRPERHGHVLRHIDQHLAGDAGDTFELVLDLLLDSFRPPG